MKEKTAGERAPAPGGGGLPPDISPDHSKRAAAAPKRARVLSALHDADGDTLAFRPLFDASPQGILIADSETRTFFYANPAACKMLGHTQQELLERGVGEIHPPEHVQRVAAEFDALARGDKAIATDVPCLRKDGSVFPADVIALPVEIVGRPMAVGFFTDITARKQSEEDRDRLQAQLAQAQKMEAVGQLAAAVAHDFRNLLTVISGHAELSMEAVSSSHRVYASLGTILEAARQAEAVTQSLLTFSRKTDVRVEPVSPAAAVQEAARLLHRLLPATIELAVDTLPDPDVRIRADYVQLKQVILNLAINARDAMPEGGRLSITCRPSEDARQPAEEGPRKTVRIEVSDTGTGMSPEVMRKIFDPFFTTKPRGHGTGLGLSIVYGIVADFDGELKVASEVGKGSTFVITFPQCNRVSEGDVPAVSTTAPHGQRETVLLADDNPQIRELLSGALTSYGYHVIMAKDGDEMLDLWMKRRGHIRIIVTDNDMPKHTGLDALLDIRRTGCRVPAILITGVVDSDYRDRLDRYTTALTKPFKLADLVERIHEMLALLEAKTG